MNKYILPNPHRFVSLCLAVFSFLVIFYVGPVSICAICCLRQRKLEEALLYSGQFKDAVQALLEWLRKVEKVLSEEGPVHGDLDTVMALVEQHKVSLGPGVPHIVVAWSHVPCMCGDYPLVIFRIFQSKINGIIMQQCACWKLHLSPWSDVKNWLNFIELCKHLFLFDYVTSFRGRFSLTNSVPVTIFGTYGLVVVLCLSFLHYCILFGSAEWILLISTERTKLYVMCNQQNKNVLCN